MKVGINGMGRIGRLALRAAMGAAERPQDDPRAANRLEVVHLNEIKGGAAAAAHLLQFDSVQGRWRADIAAEGDQALRIGEHRLGFTSHAAPAEIAWGDLGVDLVLECTGRFLTPETLQGHLDRGAKRVIVAAPVKVGDVLNVVVGVNHHRYDPARHRIVTAASCTTNCLAPLAKVFNDTFGIERGLMTTVHAYTADQNLQDGPHSDLRRARAAGINIVPTSTGAAKAIGLVLPELKGKLDGFALRVPIPTGSITDLTVQASRPVTLDEVKEAYRAAAASGPLVGILKYTEDEIVSADIVSDPHSSIFDAGLLRVIDDQVKLSSWYDNEWGYSNRLVDLTEYVAERL
jgi:glyceraldehyde 3-phosphate dehydrogenase